MKRLFTCIMTVLAFGLTAAWAQYDFSATHEGQTFYYSIVPDAATPEVTLVSDRGAGSSYSTMPSGAVIIPDEVQNGGTTYRVTSIADETFNSCRDITSVVIGRYVRSIGESAFAYATSMGTLQLPDALETIGDAAFGNCEKLGKLTLPQGVKTIGQSAFYRCMNLHKADLPQGLQEIGKSAFYGCTALTQVNLPAGLPVIDESVFYDTNLTEIALPQGLRVIRRNAFAGCPLRAVVIPATVDSVGEKAFEHCETLADITVSGTGTSLHKTAFDGTAWHNSFAKGELMYLDTYAMGYKFPAESTSPSDYDKTFIELREGTTHIADEAFGSVFIRNPDQYNKSGYPLKTVRYITIPRSVTHIGVNAFGSCTEALKTVTVPEKVQSVGEGAFVYCRMLERVTWLAEDCRLTGTIFPETLDEIEFGKEVHTIPDYICEGNTGLTAVAIPHEVTSVGKRAFYACDNLSRVALGAGVKTLGDRAFYGCSSLTTLQSYALTPPAATPYCFLDVPITASVQIPCGCIPAYEAAPEWEYFWTFTEIIAYNATGYSSNEEWGTVSVEQTCAEATFRAEPADGCRFLRWSNGETANPLTVDLHDHVELMAEFVAETTGVDGVWSDGTEVYGSDNTLFIRGNDSEVTVYDTTGRMVYRGPEREIILDRSGVYIVEIDGRRTKVVI